MVRDEGKTDVLRTAVDTILDAIDVNLSFLKALTASCLSTVDVESLCVRALTFPVNFGHPRRTLTVDGQMLCMCLALH